MPDNITVPKPPSVQARNIASVHRALSTEDQQKLAATVAPTLEHIVSAAGIKLTPELSTQLQQAFTHRGTINIQPGGPNMDVSLSVAGSCNVNGKAAQTVHE